MRVFVLKRLIVFVAHIEGICFETFESICCTHRGYLFPNIWEYLFWNWFPQTANSQICCIKHQRLQFRHKICTKIVLPNIHDFVRRHQRLWNQFNQMLPCFHNHNMGRSQMWWQIKSRKSWDSETLWNPANMVTFLDLFCLSKKKKKAILSFKSLLEPSFPTLI